MNDYTVINDFINKETGELVKAGDTISADSDRAAILQNIGVIGKQVPAVALDGEQLVSVGGGYYQLPNGDKVQGKDKALEALKALEELKQAEAGGATDGTPSGDTANS